MKKQNFFVRNYSKCYDYLRECSDFVIVSLGIFCVFILIGFAFPIFFKEEILNWIKTLTLEMQGMGMFETVWFIFSNNLRASFFAIILGIFAGIFPIVAAVLNGYLVGFVSRFAVELEGFSVLWRLVPHGIFEIPAVIISMGIGLRLGVSIFRKKERKSFRRNFLESMRFFIFVIFPLLLVAGIIEGLLIFWAS